MARSSLILQKIGQRLTAFRERRGLGIEELESQLGLGPGWLSRFESGASPPPVETLLSILSLLEIDASEFFEGIQATGTGKSTREFYGEPEDDDLLIHFKYAEHDAVYRLVDAGVDELEDILRELRGGLAPLAEQAAEIAAIKTGAVAATFLKAIEIWPDANPSDLWWFLVYRAYCDPFNHPARFARLDLTQSWKRTAGWALEEILVRFYGPHLAKHGITVEIAQQERKSMLLGQLSISDRLEPDKVDVLLSGRDRDEDICFGAVHVKSSFAERRTDDVPLSRALIEAGYASPLWTMDCKSTPAVEPVNKGELGVALGTQFDKRSAKRKDIEDDGYFSACFSYNKRTVPTPSSQPAAARIIRCDFGSPDDAFSEFVLTAWQRFKEGVGRAGDQR